MTKITSRQLATLKRNAMNVYPQIVKIEKLANQIAKLQKELDDTRAIVNATETGSRIITGGINSTDLIQRRLVDTGKFDAMGNPVKVTRWEPIEGRLTPNEDSSYTVNYSLPEGNCVAVEDSNDSVEPFSETEEA